MLPTIGLASVVLAVHAVGLRAFFVGDDFDFLVRMQRADGLSEILRMGFWGEWEPLWYLGFYRDWLLWGLSPAGFHLASIFWFAAGVILLYRIVHEVWPQAAVAPWAASLLFATHPLHDEAVTYLAARGHPMSLALALFALFAYTRVRDPERSAHARGLWRAAALGAALLAALAKETALVLPGWVVALDWLVYGRMRFAWRDVRRAIQAGAWFVLPVLTYFLLRAATVGLGSDKLKGPDGGPWAAFASFVDKLPEYALIGGVPLPFAFFDSDRLAALAPLGWVVVAAVGAPVAVTAAISVRRERRVSVPVGLCLVGLVVVALSLIPVFWADLGLRRRYFFTSSAGAALIAGVVFEWLAARRARSAWALMLLLATGGAAGAIHRDVLYVQAGRVTRDLVETIRGAPLSRPAARPPDDRKRIALVTLPRYLGGDGLSGAYLLHRTDVRSAIRIAGVGLEDFGSALKCYFAEDYRARVTFAGPDVLLVSVSFAGRRAYEHALGRSPADDREGRLLTGILLGHDDASRTIQYKVLLEPGYLSDPASELYLYNDGRFLRLTQPD